MKQTSSSSKPLLSVRDLRTYYHTDEGFVRAVDGVSFDVPYHGSVGLAGASGSGKTQTALSLLGLIDDAPGLVDGQVWLDGENLLEGLGDWCAWNDADGVLTVSKNVAKWRALHQRRLARVRGERIAMVFQEPKSSLIPYFTVGDHLRETIAARRGKAAARVYEEPALALLRRLHFEDPASLLQRYPHELSGGESQRVMLGLALLGRPPLLIADEPTTLLDAVTQHGVLETLASIVQERRLALLLITHNLALMRLLVNHVVVLFAGKVVEQGPTRDVIDHAQAGGHPYTQALLRAVPDLEASGAARSVAAASWNTAVNLRGCRYYHRCTLKDLLPEAVRRRCRDEGPPPFAIGTHHTVACWAREEGA